MSVNFFASATVVDGTNVQSTINRTDLVNLIQTHYGDPYFDTTNEIGDVWVYYTHQDGRQQKRLIHKSPSLTTTVFWSPIAHDGTWQKSYIKAYDLDGASIQLTRAQIGTLEDVTHFDHTCYLNIS